MSGCPQEADRCSCHGSRAVTWAGSFVASPLCLFFFSVANIFWNPDLRCIYLSLSHRCMFLFISEVFVRPQTNQNLPPFLSEIPCMLCCFWIVCLFIYFGYKPLLDMTIANNFSISYIISHFVDGSPWQGFQVWCTHSCSLFLSLLFLLELLPNFIAKTDVKEQSNPSILGAKCFN